MAMGWQPVSLIWLPWERQGPARKMGGLPTAVPLLKTIGARGLPENLGT